MRTQIQSAAFIAALLTFTFITSCTKDDQDIVTPQLPGDTGGTPDYSENGANPDETNISGQNVEHRLSGYIYIAGNEAGNNQIHIYKQHANGQLSYQGAANSGGAGSGAPLGSQGALALSSNQRWLFVVNAGDNTLSTLEVFPEGKIERVSTNGTGGTTPVSVCTHNNLIYVVNAGTANIKGFTIAVTGKVDAIVGSNLPLSSPNAGPAQIAFSPNGEHLYVTEKMTNTISAYTIDANGLASFDQSFSSTGNTPFGFGFSRNQFMIVSNANAGIPNGSSCTSYSGINTGNLNSVNGAVANNQTAACWVALTKYERFAYVTNTASNTISSYYVAPWGSLYLIQGNAASGNAPIDIIVAPNNFYVYAINSGNHTIEGYYRTLLGGLVSMGTTPGLPDFAAGLVAQ